MATLPFTRSWIAQAQQRFWRLAPGDREPVTLRHSRIYILPTRRGFAVIATLVIMLLTSMNYALSLGYAMTFLAAGMVAAALLATFRNLTGLASSPVAAGEAFAGGEVTFTLSLASGERERIGIVVTPSGGPPAVIDLPADATRPVVLTVAAPRRGPRAAGSGDAVDRLSAGPVARLGLRAFSSDGVHLSGARNRSSAIADQPVGDRPATRGTRRRCRARRSARL